MSEHTHTAWVHRQDSWLIIRIPELGQVTQARHMDAVEITARECIASLLGVDVTDVNVLVKREL